MILKFGITDFDYMYTLYLPFPVLLCDVENAHDAYRFHKNGFLVKTWDESCGE